MTEVAREIGPSVAIVALITLWVFLMLVGASYFQKYVPEVSGPGHWKPAFVRLGLVLAMGVIGVLVADREELPREHHMWVGLAGAVLGFVAEALWRRVHRRISAADRRRG